LLKFNTWKFKMTLRLTLGFRSWTMSDAFRTAQSKIVIPALTTQSRDSSSLASPARGSHPHPFLQSEYGFSQYRPFSVFSRLDFYLDPICYASPLKKKRKIDPAVLKRREERVRGKIQRALGRLGKFAEKLKPIDEYEVPRTLIKQRETRLRVLEPLSFEESEKRAKLRREFDDYSREVNAQDRLQILRVQASQKRALEQLKAESEELYLKAIEVDEGLLRWSSPIITSTPPIEGYEAPDGEHNDVTKTFEYDVDFLQVLEANLTVTKPKWQLKKELKEQMAALEEDDDDKKTKKKKASNAGSSGPPPLNP